MDDQDLLLSSPKYMAYLESMIVSQGVTMNNGFVATPVCCPSRTELITGRYYHNIGAPKGECMHINATQNVFSNTSLFSIMHNYGGYSTGVFGKLTNFDGKYFCKDLQNITKAGLSRVYSMCDQEDYYNTKYFDKYDNGSYQYTNLTSNHPTTYQISQVGNKSIEWITEKLELDETFIAYVGFHCPHIYYAVAPWFANTIPINISAPRTPNFNVHVNDQIPYIMNNPELNATAINSIDMIYRDRLGSTLQVDVMINDLYKALIKYDGLDNTYVIYSSDHGYHLGQWRVPCEKTLVYDTDIRVPFYIQGPNITPNSSSDIIVGNVDIMPLILDIANITNDLGNIDYIDGKSFKSNILNNNNKDAFQWREQFLVQYIIGNTPQQLTPDEYFNNCLTWIQNGSNLNSRIRPNPMSNDEYVVIYGSDIHSISNTYRMLRIINTTHDWTYAEYVNYTFLQKDFENPLLYALYDLKTDRYQIKNIYNQTSQSIKKQLHSMLMQYGQCKGNSCP